MSSSIEDDVQVEEEKGKDLWEVAEQLYQRCYTHI